ncbi:hypothetical protein RN001_014207 [Aquatica leii]|uniref:Uncharacterized protein n=1 Tax=Aquatica leii TaxID=1421715 RepID=A0AAN7SCR6_9COLE|nr:hypothetical protein RN001_014207 [Aquatica leii]
MIPLFLKLENLNNLMYEETAIVLMFDFCMDINNGRLLVDLQFPYIIPSFVKLGNLNRSHIADTFICKGKKLSG